MRYHHVLLDLDHTLLDTEASLRLAFDDAMVAVGVDPAGMYPAFDEINQALWRRVELQELTPGQVHVARFVALAEQLGLDAEAADMAAAFAHGMGARGDLYPGTHETLEQLAEMATLALITNGLSDIQRARIDRLDLEHYFAAITISAEVGTAKPETEIFDLTLRALGAPDRSKTVMVGDNLRSDIAGGNNAGIASCWYNPHGTAPSRDYPASHTIASLQELVPIVAGT